MNNTDQVSIRIYQKKLLQQKKYCGFNDVPLKRGYFKLINNYLLAYCNILIYHFIVTDDKLVS